MKRKAKAIIKRANIKLQTRHVPAGNGTMATTASIPPTDASNLISSGSVGNILVNTFRGLIPAAEFPLRTTIADNRYLTVAPDFVRNVIITDPVLSAQDYHAEIFDCDDYVLYLKTKMSLYAVTNKLLAPLAVGFLFTIEHAFSFCFGDDRRIYLINTQSDTIPVTGEPASFVQFLSLRPNNQITVLYI